MAQSERHLMNVPTENVQIFQLQIRQEINFMPRMKLVET